MAKQIIHPDVTTNSINVGSSVATVHIDKQSWHDPIDNPQLCLFTQMGNNRPWWNVFGADRGSHKHQGVDLLALPETQAYACVSGVVVRSELANSIYGHVVTIRADSPDFVRSLKTDYTLAYPEHGELESGKGWTDQGHFYFFYAHLLERSVKVGDPVAPKTPIGLTGTSSYGKSKDPHLHFEILCVERTTGTNMRVNPARYMKFKMPNQLTPEEIEYQKWVASKFWTGMR